MVGTTDGGATWTNQVVPADAVLWDLLGVSCTSRTRCQAVGGGPFLRGGDIIGTTDGGATWKAQVVPPGVGGQGFFGVSCASLTSCEAVATNPQGLGPAIVGTTDGGARWKAQGVPSGVQYVYGITCSPSATCEAVGSTPTGGSAILTYPRRVRAAGPGLGLPVHEMRLHIHPFEGSGDGLCGSHHRPRSPSP